MKNRDQIYIIAGLGTLLVIGLVVFLVYPLFRDLIKTSNDLVQQKNDTLTVETDSKSTELFKQNYATYKDNLSKISSIIVASNNIVNFFETLEIQAKESGVSIKISSPFFTASDSGEYTANLQIACTGSYSDIIKFVNALETDPYLIKVVSLKMENYLDDFKQKRSNIIQATISIKVASKP